MINGKLFSHRPINELFSIVKQDFSKFDDEGLIDEGKLIKTIMYCNDSLGINIREVKTVCLNVTNFKANLPVGLEKIYYMCGLNISNGSINLKNPFDNNIDTDVIYKARVESGTLACKEQSTIIIERQGREYNFNYSSWIPLGIANYNSKNCHIDCPNTRYRGKYEITINDDNTIDAPFKNGEIFLMYISLMCDDEGNLMFPFHPLITPYYEWSLKEKIILDAIFNTDEQKFINMLKLAQSEKSKAWVDAFNITMERGFGEYVDIQRKKELSWYNKYFKMFM